jgi:Glycosyltransferase family 92
MEPYRPEGVVTMAAVDRSSKRWTDFIAWARRARAKPTFDLEEREYRLAVAAAIRDLVTAAREGDSLQSPAAAVVERVADSIEPLLPRRQIGQLAKWAADDEEGLARTLRAVADEADHPEARFARFVREAPADLGFRGVVLGSLINFGIAPERAPVVRPREYARLRKLLGDDAAAQSVPRVEYRRDLVFVAEVEAALRDASVPIRDMVDVESLIAVCARQHALWAGAVDAADTPRSRDPDVYLAACMIFRNEADYLAEWIEFHRLVGVERFFLYDNESDDRSREVLAHYEREGLVVVHDWPGTVTSNTEIAALQVTAYDHCIATHGAEARWIAVIDADEFLFSPTGRPVSEVLTEYERWPAVAVNTPRFGTSGHVERPPGLVLENYTARLEADRPCFVKCVIDPAATTRALGAHKFEFRRGTAVDENGYPVFWNKTAAPAVERLRINHYFARSESDLRARHTRRSAERGVPPLPPSEELQQAHARAEHDDAILSYLPALRAALSRSARSDGGA